MYRNVSSHAKVTNEHFWSTQHVTAVLYDLDHTINILAGQHIAYRLGKVLASIKLKEEEYPENRQFK